MVGHTSRSDPIGNFIVEVCDRFRGLLVLRIQSGVEVFQDEVSPGFDQSGDASQHISEMRQLQSNRGRGETDTHTGTTSGRELRLTCIKTNLA